MEILLPSRIVDRHVGGNTTYGRCLERELLARGVGVGRIPSAGNAPLTALKETLAGVRRGIPGQVVHYLADTGPLLPTRRPAVVTVHGVASRWEQGIRTPRQERIWRTRVGAAIRNTSDIITVSESSADDIAEIFSVDRSRIHVILHGMDPAKPPKPTDLVDQLNSKFPRGYVSYVGNLEPRKNLVALIEAFDSPMLRDMGIPLVIAGKPAWNAESTMSAIQAAKNVEYVGFVSEEEKTGLIAGACLFVFPSLYEGFGFPVLEALAQGTPVLCSERGALSEVAGPSKMFVDLDSGSIAKSIADALGDSEFLTECAIEGPRWASKFTWSDSAERHVAVYEKALAR